MSRQMNSGRFDGSSRSSKSNGQGSASTAQRNRSDAMTKPGTTPSQAAVRIDNGGSLARPNVGPAGAPYYEQEDKKDYF